MAKLVSSTYGDALFQLALEEEKLDNIMDEVLELNQTLNQNEELLKLLNHPKIVKDEKVRIIENIFKGKISEDLMGFLTIIVSKGRHADILSILDYFIKRVKKYRKIGIAQVVSAVALSEAQKKQVKDTLLELTDYVQFEIYYTVDKEIIGGMIIRIDDRIVDSSIKTKIENMSRNLLQIQLV